jgi:hypothetical protein
LDGVPIIVENKEELEYSVTLMPNQLVYLTLVPQWPMLVTLLTTTQLTNLDLKTIHGLVTMLT